MSIQQLDHLNMTVANLEESIQWYEKIFAFVEVERGRRAQVEWAILRSGEAMLCLYEHSDRVGPDRFMRDKKDRHVIYHVGFRISDEHAWQKIVAENNLELEYGGAIEYPHSKSWYVADPTGYSIEVVLWKEDTIAFATDQSAA